MCGFKDRWLILGFSTEYEGSIKEFTDKVLVIYQNNLYICSMKLFGIDFWVNTDKKDYNRCYNKHIELKKKWGHIYRFFYFNHNVDGEFIKKIKEGNE